MHHDSHACAISLSVRQMDENLTVKAEMLSLNTIATFDVAKHIRCTTASTVRLSAPIKLWRWCGSMHQH